MSNGSAQPKLTATRVAPVNAKPKDDRDPNKLNQHLTVDFYSVLAEPYQKQTRSFDCVWEFSEVMYDCFLSCCYKMFSLFCGICIGIYWGIAFVPTFFSAIWFITPCTSCLKIVCGDWGRKCCLLYANLCIRPYTQSCAYLFRHFGDGINRRPPTPRLFPPRAKRQPTNKPEPKPKTPPPPVVEKEEPEVVVIPKDPNHFDDYDKSKIARSVKRQLMLV